MKRIEHLSEIFSKEFRPAIYDSMFEKPPKPYYTKKSMLLGWWWKDNSKSEIIERWFSFSDNPRLFLVSRTGCLDGETEIFICEGGRYIRKKLKNIKNNKFLVRSYNFKKNYTEVDSAEIFKTGAKVVYEITTEKGLKVKATKDHKFFIINKKGVVAEKELKDLKVNDKLIIVRKIYFGKGVSKIHSEKIISIKKIGKKKTFDLSVRKNHNFTLTNGILTHNSGKTVLMERMISTLSKSGYSCIVLSDIKDEYKYLKYPLSEKLSKFLPKKYERPEGLDVVVVRPLFFKTFLHETKKDVIYFQFSYKDLSPDDLSAFVGTKDFDEIILKYFYDSSTLKELIQNIKKNERAKKLVVSLENLLLHGIVGESNRFDFIENINLKKIIVINIKEYKSIHERFYQIYLRLVQKIIITAKSSGKIHPNIVFFVDEAHDIIPNREGDIGAEETARQIRVSRMYGVSYVFASQDIESVAEVVFEQSQYYFISANAPVDLVWKVSNRTQQFRYHPLYKEELAATLRRMRTYDGFRCWVGIDEKGTKRPAYIFMPVGNHHVAEGP